MYNWLLTQTVYAFDPIPTTLTAMPITLCDTTCTSDAADTTTMGAHSAAATPQEGAPPTPGSLSTAPSLRSDAGLLVAIGEDDGRGDDTDTDRGAAMDIDHDGAATGAGDGDALPLQQEGGCVEGSSSGSEAPPLLTAEEAARVLGGQVRAAGVLLPWQNVAQANLWTEFVDSEATAEYMLLPRLAAMAEALWSPVKQKQFEGFCRRMALHEALYKAKGWRHRPLEP